MLRSRPPFFSVLAILERDRRRPRSGVGAIPSYRVRGRELGPERIERLGIELSQGTAEPVDVTLALPHEALMGPR